MASEDIKFTCYVGNLDSDAEDEDLKVAFSPYGDVTETRVIYDNRDWENSAKIYGFVTFKEEKSMWDAIKEMNGKKLENSYRSMVVEEGKATRTSRRLLKRRGRVDSKGV